MKVLVLGATGMLGHKRSQVLRERFETWATIRREPLRWFTAGILDGTRIVHGVDAMLFDSVAGALYAQPRDPKDLAAKLVMLLTDRGLREAFGRHNRQRFVEHYTVDSYAANLGAAFHQALGPHPGNFTSNART